MSAKRTKLDDDAPLVADELESDAVMAIRAIMREATLGQSFPCAIPVALVHQVTQIIRRGAERQLVEARKAQLVRFIAADSLDKGNMFVVLESDYRDLCQRGIEAARRDPDAVAVQGAVLDAFIRNVLPAVSDTFVRASVLSELMAMPLSECEPVLLRLGFLVHKTDADHERVFLFSVPQIGRLVRFFSLASSCFGWCASGSRARAPHGSLMKSANRARFSSKLWASNGEGLRARTCKPRLQRSAAHCCRSSGRSKTPWVLACSIPSSRAARRATWWQEDMFKLTLTLLRRTA